MYGFMLLAVVVAMVEETLVAVVAVVEMVDTVHLPYKIM